jgi:hypothetical protein
MGVGQLQHIYALHTATATETTGPFVTMSEGPWSGLYYNEKGEVWLMVVVGLDGTDATVAYKADLLA